MKKHDEQFFNASISEIKNGYIENDDCYRCLICNEQFIKGRIYKYNDELYDARKSVEIHIKKEHKSMMNYLLNMNSAFTGLSDVQTQIIKMFALKMSDKEIASKLNVAQSTIRNHRFKLREKEKQAKVFLSIMELLSEDKNVEINSLDNELICDAHKTANQVDDRFNITDKEKEKVLETYFDSNEKLKSYPSKEKKKIIILEFIASKFEKNKKYSEKQVNDIIKDMYPDYATIRRALTEYGYIDRNKDCSQYWLKL